METRIRRVRYMSPVGLLAALRLSAVLPGLLDVSIFYFSINTVSHRVTVHRKRISLLDFYSSTYEVNVN